MIEPVKVPVYKIIGINVELFWHVFQGDLHWIKHDIDIIAVSAHDNFALHAQRAMRPYLAKVVFCTRLSKGSGVRGRDEIRVKSVALGNTRQVGRFSHSMISAVKVPCLICISHSTT